MADTLLEMEITSDGQKAINTVKTLSTDISGLESNLKNVENVLTNMYLEIGSIEKNGLKLNGTLKQSANYAKKSKSSIDSVTSSASKLSNVISTLKNSTSKFKNTISGFTSLNTLKNTLTRVASSIYSFSADSMEASETLNLFNRVFDNITENGETTFSELGKGAVKFQNELHEAFNTNKAETMKMQALYQSLGENIGIEDKYSAIMSQAMTKMTYDLASLYNKSEDEVATAIKSGVYAGQTRPMRNYGVDLTQSNLSVTLQQLGITDRAISDLSQAEKEILRYVTTLKQADIAMGDFADTMESPANQIKILKQQFTELKIAIGNIFVNGLAKILPYVNAIIMVARGLLETLAGLFGIELEDYGSGQGGVYDLSDGLEDVGDNADNASKKVKELKRQVLGFDQINNLTTPTNSGGSGSGSSGSSIGGIDQRLLDAIKDYDNGMAKVNNKAGEIRDKIMEWLGFTKEINSETGEVSWNYSNTEKSITEIAEKIGGKLGDELNKIINSIDYENIGRLIAIGLNSAIKFVNTFFDTVDFTQLGNNIAKGINRTIEDIDARGLGKALTNKISALINFVYGFSSEFNFNEFGLALVEGLRGAIDNISITKLTGGLQNIVNGILKTLTTMIKNIKWSSIGYIIIEGLNSIDFGEITHNLSQLVISIVNALNDIIEKTDWYELSKTLGKKISEAIKGIDLTELLSSLMELASNLVINFQKTATEMLSGLFEGFIQDFLGINSITKEEITDLSEKVDEYTQKIKELNKVAKEQIQNSVYQIDRAKEYEKELSTLVDSTGKVKQGEEDRAKVVIEKLNKALGTEYEITDGVITKNGEALTSYKNIEEEIYRLISAKKAEAVVNAYQDLYKETLDKIIQKNKDIEDLTNKKAEAEEKLNKVKENGNQAEIIQAENRLRWYTNQLENAKEFQKEQQNIANSYENLSAVISAGLTENDEEYMKAVKDMENATNSSFKNVLYTVDDTINNAEKKYTGFQKVISAFTKTNIDVKVNTKDAESKLDSLTKDKTVSITAKMTTNLKKIANAFGINVEANGGVYSNGSWKPITKYANGGLPSTGQMFIAREAGPELVGKIGNNTAVMNNNQIVSSVASGVAQAVASVMGSNSNAVEVYVHTDEGTVIDRINRRKRQTGVCPIEI